MNILAFGIVKEIFGNSTIHYDLEDGLTVAELKIKLIELFPKLGNLKSFMIAINNEYAQPDLVINQKDEIAIIPPVSGG